MTTKPALAVVAALLLAITTNVALFFGAQLLGLSPQLSAGPVVVSSVVVSSVVVSSVVVSSAVGILGA
ncbi:MAG: hypothetical protein AAFV53_42540, partial [Myxococcota bacterium]